MKTLVAVAILAMVLIPPALAKAKRAQSTRAQSAPQQGYQSSERPGYYHGYPLIPNPIDQNPRAYWRSPMDMMRQG